MEQQSVEMLFPAIAQWVRGYGHIEIGDQEMFGFVARALYYGNLAFEDDKPDTLAEAMAVLEKGLRKWFDEQGIDLDEGERHEHSTHQPSAHREARRPAGSGHRDAGVDSSRFSSTSRHRQQN
jgi:hypothetical protein